MLARAASPFLSKPKLAALVIAGVVLVLFLARYGSPFDTTAAPPRTTSAPPHGPVAACPAPTPCLTTTKIIDVRDMVTKFIEDDLEPVMEDKQTYIDWLKGMIDFSIESNWVFLPTKLDVSTAPRRIYIDLGARDYSGSVTKFPEYYPVGSGKWDIYAFDADPKYKPQFDAHPEVKFFPYAVWTKNETLQFGGNMGTIDAVIGGTKYDVKAIDFSEFMKNHFTFADFIFLKMDIEGAEWPVVEKMIEQGTLGLIDEFAFECHFAWEKEGYFPWAQVDTKHSRKDCIDMTYRLRRLGVVAHEWA